MKNEIYEYACPKRRMTAKQAELNKKDKSVQSVLIKPKLVVRESTAKAKSFET